VRDVPVLLGTSLLLVLLVSAAQLLAILISLVAAGVLLVTATLVSSRSVSLGLIGIVPSAVALVLVLGSMRVLGLAFNALTATVASIAVGIGVPYGIHLINRFRESRLRGMHADDAIRDSLRNTGAALIGSAVTTGLAFAVLAAVRKHPDPAVRHGQHADDRVRAARLSAGPAGAAGALGPAQGRRRPRPPPGGQRRRAPRGRGLARLSPAADGPPDRPERRRGAVPADHLGGRVRPDDG
jgi:hypothetical protein